MVSYGYLPQSLNQWPQSGLRLPSLSEAYTLATNHDVPGGDGLFWTDDHFFDANGTVTTDWAGVMSENPSNGLSAGNAFNDSFRTVCVTDPTNNN